jgi:hypothetical protein
MDTVNEDAMNALLALGFEIAVLPAGSLPHKTLQQYRTEARDCRGLNIAVRASKVFGVVVIAEAWQASFEDSEIYKALVSFGSATFEVRVGSRQVIRAYRYDWKTALVGDGKVQDLGKLHGCELASGFVAHGFVFENNAHVAPITNNGLPVADLVPALRDMLANSGVLSYAADKVVFDA